MRFRYHTLLYRLLIPSLSICQKFTSVSEPGNGGAAFAIDVDGRLWSWGNNWGGFAGQGNPELFLNSWNDFNYRKLSMIVSPSLVYTNEGELKTNWVKVQQGEYSAIAIDSLGQLWGTGTPGYKSGLDNCSPFGLPNNSGDSRRGWSTGISDNYFWKFTRAAPGFTCKDFMHNYYYTQMIGNDDKLYFMGLEWGGGWTGGGGMGNTEGTWSTPTLSPYITDSIKSLLSTGDFGSLGGAVTLDNRVLIWGNDASSYLYDYDWNVQYVRDITSGLPDKNIISFSGDYYCLFILFDDGTVWGRGENAHIGRGYDGDHSYYEWVEIAQLTDINYIAISQSTPWAIDNSGYFYSWSGYGSRFETGEGDPDNFQCRKWDEETETWSDNYNQFPTITTSGKTWKSVTCNHYQDAYHGIDTEGNLLTWGSQAYSTQLGIGTGKDATQNTFLGITDKDPVPYSCVPVGIDCIDPVSEPPYWELTIETTEPDQEFYFRINGDTVNVNIDWGEDFTSPINYTTTGWKGNSYATPGAYIIRVFGHLTGNGAGFEISDDGAFYGYPALKKTGIIGGITGIATIETTFYWCTGLTELPENLFKFCKDLIYNDDTFYFAFENCIGLTKLPADLFKGMTDLQSLYYTFYKCSGLTELPAGLFDDNINMGENAFFCTFQECTNLTTIPVDLFKYNTLVTSNAFNSTFYECNITSIPVDLFKYNTLVSTYGFAATFWNCSNLTSIPSGLFDNNTLVSTYGFSSTFALCAGLTTIPVDLFRYNTEVNTFRQAFQNCTNLASIPELLFKYNINCISFSSTFSGCNKLTLNPWIFYDNGEQSTRFAGKSVDFTACFNLSHNFTGIQGTAPDLWNINEDLNGISCFRHHDSNSLTNCSNIPEEWGGYCVPIMERTPWEVDLYISEPLLYRAYSFGNDINLYIDWGDGSGWENITSGGFHYHDYTLSGNYTMRVVGNMSGSRFQPAYTFDTNSRNAIIGVAPISGISGLTNLYGMFENCPNLTTIPANFLINYPKVTDVRSMFKNSGITSIPSGLFSNLTQASVYTNIFEGCIGLTSIPANLFDNNINVTSFNRVFSGCVNLETIPDNLFKYNTNCTNWGYAFSGCNKLSVKSNIFYDNGEQSTRFAGKSVDFRYCFYMVTVGLFNGIQGTAPDLWNCAGTFTSTLCFRNHSITSLINYDDIPTAWK